MKSPILKAKIHNHVPEVSVTDISQHLDSVNRGSLLLIDVRREEEFNNELGHIKGAKLVTLGEELNQFLSNFDKNKEIVFICRSGQRSATATLQSIEQGYKFTYNLTGGMIAWNELGLEVEKNT